MEIQIRQIIKLVKDFEDVKDRLNENILYVDIAKQIQDANSEEDQNCEDEE